MLHKTGYISSTRYWNITSLYNIGYRAYCSIYRPYTMNRPNFWFSKNVGNGIRTQISRIYSRCAHDLLLWFKLIILNTFDYLILKLDEWAKMHGLLLEFIGELLWNVAVFPSHSWHTLKTRNQKAVTTYKIYKILQGLDNDAIFPFVLSNNNVCLWGFVLFYFQWMRTF